MTATNAEGAVPEAVEASDLRPRKGASVEDWDRTSGSSGDSASRRTITVDVSKVRRALWVLLVVVAVVGVCVFAVVQWKAAEGARAEVASMRASGAEEGQARKVAADYAVGAARVDFRDFTGWMDRLTANTTPELAARLRGVQGQLEQFMVPLQWTSSSSPVAAVVKARNGDAFTVLSFVNVTTKSTQTPEGVESTATYTLTIDKAQGWQITDIASVGDALPAGG